MEFLTDLLGEIVEALFKKFINSPRIPRPVRIGVTALFFVPLAVLCFAICLLAETAVGKVLAGLSGLLVSGFFAVLVRRILR